ncbi:hypothetical protein IFR05_015482 [Cadophora sp. M221]|nr:hypothetical protein IFR05_015482 [Cadophora sp. M221]
MPSTTPPPPSLGLSRPRLLQTASAFITSYNTWSIDTILSIRSPSCIHHTLPASLNVPSRTNAEYATFLEPMLPIFRGVEFAIINSEKETVVDVAAGKVVLHCRNSADTDAGKYENEYVFILTMSEDGTLLDEIVEFIDAAYTVDFKRRISALKQGSGSSNS